MTALAGYLLQQARNNAWANHRLLGACAALGQGDFEAPRTGFFPSIKATANHILTVDWYYVDAIERALDGRAPNTQAASFFDPEEPCATAAAVQAAQRACDQRLIAVCERLTDDAQLLLWVPVMRRQGPVPERLDRLLAHLLQHQVHHRGQLHGMLSGMAVKPPQLDEFFCVLDAEARAVDFAALGWREDAVWPQSRASTSAKDGSSGL